MDTDNTIGYGQRSIYFSPITPIHPRRSVQIGEFGSLCQVNSMWDLH